MDAFERLTAIRTPLPAAGLEHAWYKLHVYVLPEALKTGWSRDRVMNEINARGVPCFVGSCSEIYQEKAFDRPGLRPRHRLPVARELGETSLMFLLHPTLSEAAVVRMADVAADVIESASR